MKFKIVKVVNMNKVNDTTYPNVPFVVDDGEPMSVYTRVLEELIHDKLNMKHVTVMDRTTSPIVFANNGRYHFYVSVDWNSIE